MILSGDCTAGHEREGYMTASDAIETEKQPGIVGVEPG